MKAKLSFVRITPRKMRLVADLVRGKNVSSAIGVLQLTSKRGAELVEKLLKSAIANAETQNKVNVDSLFIEKLTVDEGPTLKRYLPRAMGRATVVQKKTSHVSMTLGSR